MKMPDFLFTVFLAFVGIVHQFCCTEYVEIRQYSGYIERVHNDLRRQEGAADMKYMSTDRSLQARAQRWADRCGFYHQKRGFGENLAFFSSTGPPVPAFNVIRNSMRAWYDEKRIYRFGRGSCGSACHYTQMVWARTSRIGCAMRYCDVLNDENGRTFNNAMYFVCFYSPPGNYIGQTPYTPGFSCSRCPWGNVCRNGLCFGPDVGPRRLRRSLASQYKTMMKQESP